MKYILSSVLFSVIALLISCNEERNPSLNENLTYEYINYNKKSSGCDSIKNDNCAEIKIEFPLIKYAENKIVENKINESILSFFTQSVTGEMESTDFDNIMDEFIQDYELFKQEFPEASQSWIVERVGEVKLNKANILAIDFTEYAYTGGAHPNTFVSFKNFNVTSGEEILLDELIHLEKQEELTEIAEIEFRKTKNLKPDDDLGEAGFWFENNQFSLNDNFLITESGLLFYYNSYEITAYAFGPTEITLPYNRIKNLIGEKSMLKDLVN